MAALIASLIDTAAAFAVVTRIESGEKSTTTDLTIHYLRPITSGRMTATARIVRGGRRLFVLSVEVANDKQSPGGHSRHELHKTGLKIAAKPQQTRGKLS